MSIIVDKLVYICNRSSVCELILVAAVTWMIAAQFAPSPEVSVAGGAMFAAIAMINPLR